MSHRGALATTWARAPLARPLGRILAAAIVVGGMLRAIGPVHAAAPPVRLIYERGPGAESCPDEDGLRAEVAARLGQDPFAATGGRTVIARIRRDPSGLRAHIEIRDEGGKATGSRDLESTKGDCKELSSAVAFAISMAIDPLAATGPSPSASSPSETPAPAGSTVVPIAEPASPAIVPSPPPSAGPPASSTPSEPIAIRATLGGYGSLGIGPTAQPGVSAAVGVASRTWSFDLEGRRDVPIEAARGAGQVSASVLALSISPCIRREGPATFGLCALASLGALQGSGNDVRSPRSETGVWGAVGVRALIEVRLGGPFAAGAALDLLAPVVRTTLVLDGSEVWSTASLSGNLGLRVIAAF
jgi:hypothetical protein